MTDNLYPNTDSKFVREVWGTTELITIIGKNRRKKCYKRLKMTI